MGLDISQRNMIIAQAVDAPIDSMKTKFAIFCDNHGLLQSRLVRHLLGIDCKSLSEKIKEAANKLAPAKGNELRADFNALLEKKWKVQKFCPLKKTTPHYSPRPPYIVKIGLPENKLPSHQPHSPLINIKDFSPHIKPSPSPELSPTPHQDPTPDQIGSRTVLMNRFLEKEIVGYKNGTVPINGKIYQALSAEVSDFSKPIVSCGSSSSRELILFDPSSSPVLRDRYAKFEKIVKSYVKARQAQDPSYKLSPQRLSLLVNKFVRDEVFPSCKQPWIEKQVDDFVELKRKTPSIHQTSVSGKNIPCISIDDFIENGLGVCRHHSLVTAFMLDRFMSDHPDSLGFKGKAQVMRDNLQDPNGNEKGAHAWVTLVTDGDDICAIDTLNDQVSEIGTEKQFGGGLPKSYLERAFGAQAVKNQIAKAKHLKKKAFHT